MERGDAHHQDTQVVSLAQLTVSAFILPMCCHSTAVSSDRMAQQWHSVQQLTLMGVISLLAIHPKAAAEVV